MVRKVFAIAILALSIVLFYKGFVSLYEGKTFTGIIFLSLGSSIFGDLVCLLNQNTI